MCAFFGTTLSSACARTSAVIPSAIASGDATKTSVEIRLPYDDFSKLGCLRRAGSGIPTGTVGARYYSWILLHEFPGGDYPANHAMTASFSVEAPSAKPFTVREFNRAARNVNVVVYEGRGEPVQFVNQTRVPRASIRFDPGFIRLRFEGTVAVTAFLRANTDRVRVLSCPTSPADVNPLPLTRR